MRLTRTAFSILTASLSSSTDHDSSELLWDDEFNQEEYDLFGTDHSIEGDYDDFFGGGGVYGCVSPLHFTTINLQQCGYSGTYYW